MFRQFTAVPLCKRLQFSFVFLCTVNKYSCPQKKLYPIYYTIALWLCNLQWLSPHHLCFPHLLFLPEPALFVVVDIAVKYGNAHERQRRRRGRRRRRGLGLLLFAFSICLLVQKEFWENRDGEALSQLPPCPFCSPCWGCCCCCCWLLWPSSSPCVNPLTDTHINGHAVKLALELQSHAFCSSLLTDM